MTMGWIHILTRNVLIHCGNGISKDIFFCSLLSRNKSECATLIHDLIKDPLLCCRVTSCILRHHLFGIANQQHVYFSTKASASDKPRKVKHAKESSHYSQDEDSENQNPIVNKTNIKTYNKSVPIVSTVNTTNNSVKQAISESESAPLLDNDSCSSRLEKLKSNINKTSRKKYSYVFKQNVAEKIATAIYKHRENQNAPVLDIEAVLTFASKSWKMAKDIERPGLVSRELLKQGVSKVVALDGNSHFSTFLLNMESKVAAALMPSSSPRDSSEVAYSLISIGGKNNNEHFIYYIVRNLPNEDTILAHDRVEFFFLAHPKFKHKIDYIATFKMVDPGEPSIIRDKTIATHFGYIHALIYLLYDVQTIDQFNADDFYPAFNSIKAKQDKSIDPSKRLLIRMQLKRNVKELLPLEHHTPFMNFLHQLYRKKIMRTIPTMEMLVPGCGLRMLLKGFTMMDMIIATNPNKFLELYKVMLNWPEYLSSPLHSHLTMKMTGSVDNCNILDED